MVVSSKSTLGLVDSEVFLSDSFLKLVIPRYFGKRLNKTSYQYVSPLFTLNVGRKPEEYINKFLESSKKWAEVTEELDPALISDNVIVGAIKGISKIGNKHDIEFGKETRPRDINLLVFIWLNFAISFLALAYTIINMFSPLYINNKRIIIFSQEFISYSLPTAVIFFIPFIAGIIFKWRWYEGIYFYKKRGYLNLWLAYLVYLSLSVYIAYMAVAIEQYSWRIDTSVMLLFHLAYFLGFSGIGALAFFIIKDIKHLIKTGSVEHPFVIFSCGALILAMISLGVMDVLIFGAFEELPVFYSISLTGTILTSMLITYCIKRFLTANNELTARDMSTFWVIYQLGVEINSEEYTEDDILVLYGKKMEIQFLLFWDFRSISIISADPEEAKKAFIKFKNELESSIKV